MSNIINTATIAENQTGEKVIKITFDYTYDCEMLYKIRSLPCRQYHHDPPNSCWSIPFTMEGLEQLQKWEFIIDEKLQDYAEKEKQRKLEFAINGIPGLKCTPRPFQNLGVSFIEDKKGRALVADEMGLGKTIQALAWLQMHRDKIPVVIVVPASLKLNWQREAEKWLPEPNTEILSGTKPWKTTGDILIINYEILFAWVNMLKTINPNVLILDEIHYIKDNSANQTKAVKKLNKGIPHVICLSGMSIAARPIEAFNAIKLINPELFPSFAEYSRRYGNIKPYYYGWESYGVSPGSSSVAFRRSEEKITEFMNWLHEQVKKGLIEIREFEQIGDGIEAEWTNKYIADSYKRKEMRSRYELAKAGIKVPSTDDTRETVISMSTPFHIDRVGLLFTRVFTDLPGITDAMDAVISRILSQGMADGNGSALLARKLEAAINGTGLGDLGITDTFITDTIGQHISAKRRAQMLAHTEMKRAYHQSTIQEYRNWAVEGVIVLGEWKTAGDNRVCDLCNALEGKIFSLDEIEGMIPLHPECRCIALPYIEELQKYYSKPKEEVDWLGLREGIDTRKSHIPELYGILTTTIMIRRLKKDVLKDLPYKIYSFVPIELDNVKEYNEAEKDFIAFVKREKKSNVAVKESSSQALASIEGLILLAVKGKLSQSMEWIKNFLEVGSKLVVFTTHKFVIEALIQAFPKVSVKFDGSITSVEKQKAVDNFQTNPDIRLFVGDIQAAGVGITLNTASNIAFHEIPLSLGVLIHVNDCCQRTGQKVCVNIHYLFAANTIEERTVKLIEKRQRVSDTVFEGNEKETASLLSELMKNYE